MVAGYPGRLSSTTSGSNIFLMEMYCDTLVWRQEICYPIGHRPLSASASPIGGYSQRLFQHQGIHLEICYATWLWRLPSAHRIQGETTQNFDPKSITDWITTTKNLREVLVSAPLGKTDGKTSPIYSVLSGVSEPPWASCCCQRTAPFPCT